MCFSAEASLGAAIVLLPAGAYCIDAAWRKDRRYLLLATVPLLFGLQQLCESIVWVGIDHGNGRAVRAAALAYLGFALAVWPVWIPVSLAAIEKRRSMRAVQGVVAGAGVVFAIVTSLPLASTAGGREPAIVGHSIRYDLSGVSVIHSPWWSVWLAVYLITVSAPMMVSRNHRLRPVGVIVILAAAVSYFAFEQAFASVWCFFAAILSLCIIRVLHLVPEREPGKSATILHPLPSTGWIVFPRIVT